MHSGTVDIIRTCTESEVRTSDVAMAQACTLAMVPALVPKNKIHAWA